MMSRKGLKYIFRLIGKKLFRRETCNREVEYGQTLSKKRRKNCILKSVSTLTEQGAPEISDWVDAPYHIKFEFSSDEREFRGSVLNFQKIDPTDECCMRNCCEKCFCTLKSTNSLSSDSACEVASRSSCADYDCPYGRTSTRASGSVEDFIRIHEENFLNDWETDEPNYETLPRPVETKSDCDYDILLSKTNCNILEPSYENLKLVENFYETPKNIVMSSSRFALCSDNCAVKKIKDLVQANKTYDEVIESLKIFHSNTDTGKLDSPENCKCIVERDDNDINDYLESFKSYENDVNNDVESVSFQY